MDHLDYSHWVVERYQPDGRGHISFYPGDNGCPFCQGPPRSVFSKGIVTYDPEQSDTRADIHHLVAVLSCRCGWWTLVHDQTPDAHDLRALPQERLAIRGALRRFDTTGTDAALAALRREIQRHPEVLDAISPRKMEELTGAVLSDYFPGCRAKVCGKSGDGGIDLLLIISDKPFAVQVKHRERVDLAEPVSAIREFIGAMVLGDHVNGLYVTTADRFSPASRHAARTIIQKGFFDTFRLIDRHAFLEMMEITAEWLDQPWQRHIPRWFRNTSARQAPWSLSMRSL